MQLGFMLGKGTTDAIFTVQQMQEKYGCKGKKLYFAFVDLEKHLIEYLERYSIKKEVLFLRDGLSERQGWRKGW